MSEVTTDAPITTSAEEKPAEAKPAEAQAEASLVTAETEVKATEPIKEVAEVKYDLKLPEGSKLGAEIVESVASFAKERGFSPEQAQAILDREIQAKAADAEAQATQVRTLNDKTWKSELQQDKEIGGANFEKSGQLAYKGAEFLFGAGGVDNLVKANLNHHPMLFKGLVKLGKLMDQDKIVLPGSQSAPAEKSVADLFYGNTNKE